MLIAGSELLDNEEISAQIDNANVRSTDNASGMLTDN